MDTKDYQTASRRLRELSRIMRQNVPHLKIIDDFKIELNEDLLKSFWSGNTNYSFLKQGIVEQFNGFIPRLNPRKRMIEERMIDALLEKNYNEFMQSHQ